MKEEEGCLVAESEADFNGMRILYIEFWKEGVRRVWAEKDGQCFIIFSDISYTRNLKEE